MLVPLALPYASKLEQQTKYDEKVYDSSTDSSDCDDSDPNSDEISVYDTGENDISDSESYFTTTDEEESSEFGDLLIASPPEVLERSTLIEKCPGIPDLMKHRG